MAEARTPQRLAYEAKYREKNRERLRLRKNAWRLAKRLANPKPKRELKGRDPAKNRARVQRWIAANPERNREHKRRWQKENRPIVAAKAMRRIAAKKLATPRWADHEQIQQWYEVAAILSKTGVVHQVDHIVPLVSPLVCGLHTHDNLQVLAAWQNRSKGNRLEE